MVQRVGDGEEFAFIIIGERSGACRSGASIGRRGGSAEQIALRIIGVRSDVSHGIGCRQHLFEAVVRIAPGLIVTAVEWPGDAGGVSLR